jgi:mycoredoxin
MSEMQTITLYTTEWCSYCRSLKQKLNSASLAYREVDIEKHPEYGSVIERLTGGYRTVPTVEVCGSFLVNPSVDEIVEALERCASYS